MPSLMTGERHFGREAVRRCNNSLRFADVECISVKILVHAARPFAFSLVLLHPRPGSNMNTNADKSAAFRSNRHLTFILTSIYNCTIYRVISRSRCLTVTAMRSVFILVCSTRQRMLIFRPIYKTQCEHNSRLTTTTQQLNSTSQLQPL